MASQLHLHILASGSKGNATIVESDNTLILIDCGISRKQVFKRCESLGIDANDIKYVLLTHEHSDHTKGLKILNKYQDVQMFTTKGTAEAKKATRELSFETIKNSDSLLLGDINVDCFATSHDVADPIGFRFSKNGDSIGYCTDTGTLSDRAIGLLSDTRILALEANHDEKMLINGDYPTFLKERIASDEGHLSNVQTANYLKELVTDRCQSVIGMHLSQDNNQPSVCVKNLSEALGATPINDIGTKAQKENLKIMAAGQMRPITLM